MRSWSFITHLSGPNGVRVRPGEEERRTSHRGLSRLRALPSYSHGTSTSTRRRLSAYVLRSVGAGGACTQKVNCRGNGSHKHHKKLNGEIAAPPNSDELKRWTFFFFLPSPLPFIFKKKENKVITKVRQNDGLVTDYAPNDKRSLGD